MSVEAHLKRISQFSIPRSGTSEHYIAARNYVVHCCFCYSYTTALKFLISWSRPSTTKLKEVNHKMHEHIQKHKLSTKDSQNLEQLLDIYNVVSHTENATRNVQFPNIHIFDLSLKLECGKRELPSIKR